MRPIDADALSEAIERDFDGVSVYDASPSEAVRDFQDIVDRQPTIQPEKAQLSQEGTTKDATSDTISRQAAIDALDCINGVEEVLRSLPPVQPEPHEGHWIER